MPSKRTHQGLIKPTQTAFESLPDATVITAELDPLMSEGQALAAKDLKQAFSAESRTGSVEKAPQ